MRSHPAQVPHRLLHGGAELWLVSSTIECRNRARAQRFSTIVSSTSCFMAVQNSWLVSSPGPLKLRCSLSSQRPPVGCRSGFAPGSSDCCRPCRRRVSGISLRRECTHLRSHTHWNFGSSSFSNSRYDWLVRWDGDRGGEATLSGPLPKGLFCCLSPSAAASLRRRPPSCSQRRGLERADGLCDLLPAISECSPPLPRTRNPDSDC